MNKDDGRILLIAILLITISVISRDCLIFLSATSWIGGFVLFGSLIGRVGKE